MSKHMPPVPPENRSDKGPGGSDKLENARDAKVANRSVPDNTEEQGRQGNIKQNTTHQGHQQDR